MLRKTLHISLIIIFLAVLQPVQIVPAQTPVLDKYIYLPLIKRGYMAPVLKWQRGGCYASWCETGWYSSPAVADIGGGKKEVIASAYSVWGLDGDTGALKWSTNNTSNRTWPGVALADIDKDGNQEVVVAQSGGWVTAYTLAGVQKWRTQIAGGAGELRGMLVADLDNNNSTMEVVVTRGYGSGTNTWVLNSSGGVLGGKWPQMTDGTGYAWGVYNSNPAAGDLVPGTSGLELVVPSDVHYINAFDKNGNSIAANAASYPGKYWGQVGMWEDPTFEKTGGSQCTTNLGRSARYRANFADGPATIADLNGDGIREVVTVGNMQDCAYSPYASRYRALFILNADRSRFNSGGYDWRTLPTDTGTPLSEDYDVIQTNESNPVVANLDGDPEGKKEILFSSYDGRVHAFWLDKTEHGFWPYSVYHASEGVIRFASEPVVADLDNDGQAEVIFTSWVQSGSYKTGKLHILSYLGTPIYEVDLPMAVSPDDTWNGAMAAPTLANIDSDADLEVVVNTANSGVVAYDLPGTAGATILWGTGRGDYTRKASR
jgi:hypothetical protein